MEIKQKIAESSRLETDAVGVGCTGRFFIILLLRPLIILQPLDLQECTVPHLKDLIHICLEPEA